MNTRISSLIDTTRYWEAALGCFEDGQTAVQAIGHVWAGWTPTGDIDALGAIIGAIYADTYWNGVRMRKKDLARDLQAGTGLDRQLCQRSARRAFAVWSGLYLRPDMTNHGQIPKIPPVTDSPDVLAGSAPLSPEHLIKQWNVTDWGPLGIKNFAYGRAQSLNFGVPITAPELKMYYVGAALNPPPSSWVRLYTVGNNKVAAPLVDLNGGGTILPTGRCANAVAFDFSPSGADRFSLIALACTKFFRNDPLQPWNNWNQAQWLASNGAAGWRDLQIDAPADTAELAFENPDDTAEVFEITVHAADLPPGSEVRLKPAGLGPEQTFRTDARHQSFCLRLTVPAGFAGKLRAGFPRLAGHARLNVGLRWILHPRHPRFSQALDLMNAAPAPEIAVPLGSFALCAPSDRSGSCGGF